MAKIKGSIGIVSVRFQDVLSVLGSDYNGFIDVRKSWFDSHIAPQTEMVMIKSEELGKAVRPVEVETVTPLIPPARRPKVSTDFDNID
jgi:hypothetical protein